MKNLQRNHHVYIFTNPTTINKHHRKCAEEGRQSQLSQSGPHMMRPYPGAERPAVHDQKPHAFSKCVLQFPPASSCLVPLIRTQIHYLYIHHIQSHLLSQHVFRHALGVVVLRDASTSSHQQLQSLSFTSKKKKLQSLACQASLCVNINYCWPYYSVL